MSGSSGSAPRQLPPFAPARWLRGGNRQTLAGAYLYKGKQKEVGERTVLTLPDGDQILIADAAPATWLPGHRIAILLHGLGGTLSSPYMTRVTAKLRERGVRTISVNMRGYGEGAPLAKGPGHAGRSEDALEVARHVSQRYPNSPITMLGFSMGGNIVLKLAGEHADLSSVNIDSCWSAAPPMAVARCAANMRRPDRKLYAKSFVRMLWKQFRASRKYHASLQQVELGARPTYIDEFDDRFTAPLSGYRDVTDYYNQASSFSMLPDIKVATQIIAAADDPIVPVEMFEEAETSPSTELHIVDSGGHIGFVAQPGVDPDRRWLDWRAVDWVMQQGLKRPS